jgi:hypothetical protein
MNKTVAFKMPAPKTQAADAWVGEGVEACPAWRSRAWS